MVCFNQIYAISKFPKSHHFEGILQKAFNFTNSLGTPGGFLLDHYSSYHYTVIQHSPRAHSIARTPSTQPVVRRPPPEQPQQPVKRPPRLVKIFFFFFHKILLLSNAIFFYNSPSYYSLMNIFLRINSFIPFSDTICRQTEKQ